MKSAALNWLSRWREMAGAWVAAAAEQSQRRSTLGSRAEELKHSSSPIQLQFLTSSAPAQIERAAAQLQQIAANKELSAAQRQAAAALAAQASGTLSHVGFGGAETVQDSSEDHEHYGTVLGAVSSGVELVLLGAAGTVIWSVQLLSPVPCLLASNRIRCSPAGQAPV